jgi:hypothetical protein
MEDGGTMSEYSYSIGEGVEGKILKREEDSVELDYFGYIFIRDKEDRLTPYQRSIDDENENRLQCLRVEVFLTAVCEKLTDPTETNLPLKGNDYLFLMQRSSAIPPIKENNEATEFQIVRREGARLKPFMNITVCIEDRNRFRQAVAAACLSMGKVEVRLQETVRAGRPERPQGSTQPDFRH